MIAILIAVASVLAGIATWRSDSDNRAAIDAINAADVQDRERQGAIDEIDANLNDSRITLVRVRVDERRARALAATARAKGAPPGRAAAPPRWPPATRPWPRSSASASNRTSSPTA